MHSDWKFWEFFKSGISVLAPGKRVHALYLGHPIFEKFVIQDLRKNFQAISFEEVSQFNQDWLDQNFISRSLFDIQDDNKAKVFFQSELLDSNAKTEILEKGDFFQKNNLILFFNRKDDFFKTIGKKDWSAITTVSEPKFWEFDKVLKVLSDKLNLRLDYSCEQYLLENVENSISNFYDSLEKLKLYFGTERVLKAEDANKVIGRTKFDLFSLARMFSKKQSMKFYSELLNNHSDYKQLDEIFRFLIGHMIKMADTSYVDRKDRPSKYDKEIQSYAKFWKGAEIQRELIFLNQMLVLAKSKDPELFTKIKSASIEAEVIKQL